MTVPVALSSVVSVPRPTGGQLLFNTSETEAVMLRDVSKSEMSDQLVQFRAQHRAWMFAELLSPQDDVDVGAMGGTAPGLLTGLSGRFADVPAPKPGQERRWDLIHLHTGKEKNESLAFA